MLVVSSIFLFMYKRHSMMSCNLTISIASTETELPFTCFVFIISTQLFEKEK